MGIMDLHKTIRCKDERDNKKQTTPEPPSANLHPCGTSIGLKISSFQTPSTVKHIIIPILEMALKKSIDSFLETIKVVVGWETRGRQ